MESIECFRTKTNLNGNPFQIRINHNRRTIEKGYFIFPSSASDAKHGTPGARAGRKLPMCYDRGYKYISVIQDSWYIGGKLVPNNNPVCIATYTTMEAVKR